MYPYQTHWTLLSNPHVVYSDDTSDSSLTKRHSGQINKAGMCPAFKVMPVPWIPQTALGFLVSNDIPLDISLAFQGREDELLRYPGG